MQFGRSVERSYIRRIFMEIKPQFYIDGKWVDPVVANSFNVINAATEEVSGQISLGSSADVDVAVAAARRAFLTYSKTSVHERLKLLKKIIEGFNQRRDELAHAMTLEMSTPITFSKQSQTNMAL